MNKYRVSKYNPIYRNKQGNFFKDEWTSYSDIGKIYNKKIFSKAEYLLVEKQYCDAIIRVLKFNDIKEVVIKELECWNSVAEIKDTLNKYGLPFSIDDQDIIYKLENEQSIKISDIRGYLKLLFRECFWCKFVSKDFLCTIEFGYDFYVYICCQYISIDIIDFYNNIGIFIEKIDNE